MRVVECLRTRCPLCQSFNLEVLIPPRDFPGVVVKCRACSFEDFVPNPFGDIRLFLDRPKNWALVYAGKKSIEW